MFATLTGLLRQCDRCNVSMLAGKLSGHHMYIGSTPCAKISGATTRHISVSFAQQHAQQKFTASSSNDVTPTKQMSVLKNYASFSSNRHRVVNVWYKSNRHFSLYYPLYQITATASDNSTPTQEQRSEPNSNNNNNTDNSSEKKSRFSNWTGKNSWKSGLLSLVLAFGACGASLIYSWGKLPYDVFKH